MLLNVCLESFPSHLIKNGEPPILLVGSHPGNGNDQKKAYHEKNEVTNRNCQKLTQQLTQKRIENCSQMHNRSLVAAVCAAPIE
jgi:hypothetical protein